MLLVLSACGEGTVKDSNIPWYISERIKDGTVQNYNYPDSLKKYQELSSKEISNQNKYKSYIVDLEFRIGNKSTEKLKSEFELLFKSDKATICDEIIKPGLTYISPNDRPSRRYSRPYITALDIDYFIDKCLECNLIEDSLSTPYEIAIPFGMWFGTIYATLLWARPRQKFASMPVYHSKFLTQGLPIIKSRKVPNHFPKGINYISQISP